MDTTQTAQLVQVAQSVLYAAGVIFAAIMAVVGTPWLKAHKAQVEAKAASIKNDTWRTVAEDVVRWLETDPTQKDLPGLVQRANGIVELAGRLGVSTGAATPLLDAAYNGLVAGGKVVIAPPPTLPTAIPEPSNLSALEAKIDALGAALAGAVQLPAPQQPPTDPPPAAPTPVPVTPQPSPSSATANAGYPVPPATITASGAVPSGLPVGG